MVFKKPDGSQYDVDGKLYDEIPITMIIDGYNAPITGKKRKMKYMNDTDRFVKTIFTD